MANVRQMKLLQTGEHGWLHGPLLRELFQWHYKWNIKAFLFIQTQIQCIAATPQKEKQTNTM